MEIHAALERLERPNDRIFKNDRLFSTSFVITLRLPTFKLFDIPRTMHPTNQRRKLSSSNGKFNYDFHTFNTKRMKCDRFVVFFYILSQFYCESTYFQ